MDSAERARHHGLQAIFVSALLAQNAIAIPYMNRNGLSSARDFFVGDILRTTPGRFAMVDLAFVVLGFHTWAFVEARRLRITGWWITSLIMTFGVGIASAIPFFLLTRDRALDRHGYRESR